MAESPAVRSQTDGDEIVEYPHANIGIAVGVHTERGLVAPVLRHPERMTIPAIADELGLSEPKAATRLLHAARQRLRRAIHGGNR